MACGSRYLLFNFNLILMTHRYQKLRDNALTRLREELPDNLKYHNYEHTYRMLELVNEYVAPYSFTANEVELLQIAILFHDMGFLLNAKNHEFESSHIAQNALKELDFSEDEIRLVKSLIIATRLPQEPENDLERIICDIDLDYLGRKNYFEISETLYEEWLLLGIIKDRKEWKQKELNFLKNHQYHSIVGIQERQPMLNKNLEKILSSRT